MAQNKMVIVGAIVVLVVLAVVVYILFTKKAAGATTSTTGTTPGTSSQTYAVSISASDAKDSFVRNWTVYNSTGQVAATQQQSSGSTMTVNLAAGDYTLVISQTGGTAYGTYSGTIQTPSGTGAFSGANASTAVAFSVP